MLKRLCRTTLPFAHEIGPDFVLMQDGARAHTSMVTTRFLEDSGLQVMDWPPRSPDLNCIEHLWNIIGRRLHNRQHQPQTLQELEDALLEQWKVIPQETIRRSMCQAVIRARGVATHVIERPFSLSLSLSFFLAMRLLSCLCLCCKSETIKMEIL